MTKARSKFSNLKSWIMLVLLTGLAAMLIAQHVFPTRKVYQVDIPHHDLVSIVQSLTFDPAELPELSPQEKQLASLGHRLFNDPRFSLNQKVACSSCHATALAFADGKKTSEGLHTTGKNAMAPINTIHQHWFFWDGRADSLASQAIKPIEDPLEHGFSRLGVARLLFSHYRGEYRENFGHFPETLDFNRLPDHALPESPRMTLEQDVAAYSLAMLGSMSLLNDVLGTAQRRNIPPIRELSERAFAGAAINQEWIANWNDLSNSEQIGINQVFSNFGRALAAYQKQLVAYDAPFDLFARNLSAQTPVEGAFVPGFGEQELRGLQLFAGPAQCILCHNGPNLSDQQFHNIGLEQISKSIDLGRATGILKAKTDPFNCTGQFLTQPLDQLSEACLELPIIDTLNFELVAAFKTPGLRNVAHTAPYMHDGRFSTLDQVLDHYSELNVTPATGHREESLVPLRLNTDDQEAIKLFLHSLSSPITDRTLEEVVWQPKP